MTQGLFIGNRRPKSKKEVKEAIAAGTPEVYAEATSFHGNEFDGRLSDLAVGQQVVFVGPDPHRDRRFYGTVKMTANGLRVT
jgi:hypothetical protein